MARQSRLDLPDIPRHVDQRPGNRPPGFSDNADRQALPDAAKPELNATWSCDSLIARQHRKATGRK
jgi:hypothetical protein